MSQCRNLDDFTSWLSSLNPDQEEYLQATQELAGDVMETYADNAVYKKWDVLRRLSVPDRIIHFNVCWLNDEGNVEINRGWRVQHSNLIGPYKGGLRFHPTVNESVLKFLAFEQIFKNALTSLPIGGAKGGSDFNPKHRSDHEIMRFCQAFMNELHRHIGPNTDVPAGDINVGNREIGYLYGEYRRINNRFGGALTGKDISFGGSHVRKEATGFGLVYMLQCVLEAHETSMEGLRVVVSGAGNVALHAALKAAEAGAKVVTLSNSRGCLFNENGFSPEDIKWAVNHKGQPDNILTTMQDERGGEWEAEKTPWHHQCDVALPCATQNELHEENARELLRNGCRFVLEGANMPCTAQAVTLFHEAKIPYVSGKASNAGGVALSGLEMSQNASFRPSSYQDLDQSLQNIMKNIHQQCLAEGQQDGWINYAKGANIAAFRRLADAMVLQGL